MFLNCNNLDLQNLPEREKEKVEKGKKEKETILKSYLTYK